MIKDGQVRSLLRWLDEGCTLREAARRCGMDEKTARRYRKPGTIPPPRGPRSWRTRPDVFASVWPQVQSRLEADPQLQAVTLFRELLREHPELFQECHRRTFERRINQWQATTGPARSVFFDQVHRFTSGAGCPNAFEATVSRRPSITSARRASFASGIRRCSLTTTWKASESTCVAPMITATSKRRTVTSRWRWTSNSACTAVATSPRGRSTTCSCRACARVAISRDGRRATRNCRGSVRCQPRASTLP